MEEDERGLLKQQARMSTADSDPGRSMWYRDGVYIPYIFSA